MIYVIDVHGNPKQVPADYVLQPGEIMRTPLLMRDAAVSGGRITVTDSQPLRDAANAAREADNAARRNAWRDGAAGAQSLPTAIYDALPTRHKSVLPSAITAVNDARARGDVIGLRHAIDDLRRHNANLAPLPGLHSLTNDAASAVQTARAWCDELCETTAA